MQKDGRERDGFVVRQESLGHGESSPKTRIHTFSTMKSPQQVWEEAYPDRRKWDALDQDTRDEWRRVVMVAVWATYSK